MSKLIIAFQNLDVMQPHPWPVGINDEDIVTSGLGDDDGAKILGFGTLGEQSVSVWIEEARRDPASVVGLAPTFSNRGGFFEWQHVVAELSVIEPDPEAGMIPVEALYAAEHQRRMAEEA